MSTSILENEPLWYKDAILYEVHIKSFCDGNNDGIGDFKGLISKLDYLEDLGVTAIWLLPFYPSPLKDDGYDISDYFGINPDYGTLQDFKTLLKGAHARGIRVITELVLNHTSDQHPWFQRARRAKSGSVERDYYVWNDDPHRYQDARIIFQDFESSNWTWDSVARSYYWHRFYSHQPDLNFDNPQVQKEMIKIVDFWLGMGVDGLRLDAVPYLYERDQTNCENLPETHAYLKRIREHIDSHYQDKMLLAEANQWPEDAVDYFGEDDECHMAFHFPLMPRIFMSVQMEDRFPIIDIMEQTPDIPNNAQWALFLRNHDELTLEMVTDEERDYMYRVYARDPQARINLGIRRRLAPLLGNDRRKIELVNILLVSMPGTPVIYYGDEIGMGDNYYLGDRNGVRTPMQWSPDRNGGFSKVNPQRLYLPVIIDPEYHFEAVNVENQQANLSSLFWWTKRLITMRKKYPAFGRGNLEFLFPDNPKVLTFTRNFEDKTILVVINLSKSAQALEMDLSAYAGRTPIELFSQNEFPKIKDLPYVLTMGPYDYFWFSLEKDAELTESDQISQIVEDKLSIRGEWRSVFRGKLKERMEHEVLPRYLRKARWFSGDRRKLDFVSIKEILPLGKGEEQTLLLFLEVNERSSTPDIFSLMVAFKSGPRAGQIVEKYPESFIVYLECARGEGILYDAVYDRFYRRLLLNIMLYKRSYKVGDGVLTGYPGLNTEVSQYKKRELNSQIIKQAQRNTACEFEDSFFMKFYRKVDAGINPEVEIFKKLQSDQSKVCVPAFAGAIEYRPEGRKPVFVALLQSYISYEMDGWAYALDAVTRYFDQLLSRRITLSEVPHYMVSENGMYRQDIPDQIKDLTDGVLFEFSDLLGKRTAELHALIASYESDVAFVPEKFTKLYQRSLYQSIQSQVRRVYLRLNKEKSLFDMNIRVEVNRILELKDFLMQKLQRLSSQKINGVKIRIHNDYHLGQILYTGRDIKIIDFEGHPHSALSERRLKRSPILDVVEMMRSFHYAAYHALLKYQSLSEDKLLSLQPWADTWYLYISEIFYRSYLDGVKDSGLLPSDEKELKILFEAIMVEKIFNEIEYQMDNDPSMIVVPLMGLKVLLAQHREEK